MSAAIYVIAVLLFLAFLHGQGMKLFPEPKEPPERFAEEREIAGDLGLSVDPMGRMVGRYEGAAVTVHERSVNQWNVTANVGFPLPSRISARALPHPDSGAIWRVDQGPERDLLWLMGGPVVREATAQLFEHGIDAKLNHTLALAVPTGRLERGLGAAARLVTALAARRSDAIAAVENRMESSGMLFRGPREVLLGRLDGIEIELTLPWVEGEAWRAALVVKLPRPLPRNTWIRSGPHVNDLGDLVLDKAPIEVRSSDLAALRERIATDAVRGLLLDELCENRKSVVHSDEIRLARWEGALDVASLVERGMELARVLSG